MAWFRHKQEPGVRAPAGPPPTELAWRTAQPLQRTTGSIELTAPVSRTTESLSSWHSPAFTEPLGHFVDAAAPHGEVAAPPAAAEPAAAAPHTVSFPQPFAWSPSAVAAPAQRSVAPEPTFTPAEPAEDGQDSPTAAPLTPSADPEPAVVAPLSSAAPDLAGALPTPVDARPAADPAPAEPPPVLQSAPPQPVKSVQLTQSDPVAHEPVVLVAAPAQAPRPPSGWSDAPPAPTKTADVQRTASVETVPEPAAEEASLATVSRIAGPETAADPVQAEPVVSSASDGPTLPSTPVRPVVDVQRDVHVQRMADGPSADDAPRSAEGRPAIESRSLEVQRAAEPTTTHTAASTPTTPATRPVVQRTAGAGAESAPVAPLTSDLTAVETFTHPADRAEPIEPTPAPVSPPAYAQPAPGPVVSRTFDDPTGEAGGSYVEIALPQPGRSASPAPAVSTQPTQPIQTLHATALHTVQRSAGPAGRPRFRVGEPLRSPDPGGLPPTFTPLAASSAPADAPPITGSASRPGISAADQQSTGPVVRRIASGSATQWESSASDGLPLGPAAPTGSEPEPSAAVQTASSAPLHVVQRSEAGTPRPVPAGDAAIAAGVGFRDDDGSVVFAQPPPRFSSPSVQRADEPPAAAPAQPAPATATAAAAPAPAAGAGSPDQLTPGQLEELSRRLFEPLSARIKTELRLERERAGVVTDLRR